MGWNAAESAVILSFAQRAEVTGQAYSCYIFISSFISKIHVFAPQHIAACWRRGLRVCCYSGSCQVEIKGKVAMGKRCSKKWICHLPFVAFIPINLTLYTLSSVVPLFTCTRVADFQHVGTAALRSQQGHTSAGSVSESAAPASFTPKAFVIFFVSMLAAMPVWELLTCNQSQRLQHGCLQLISLSSLEKELLIHIQ